MFSQTMEYALRVMVHLASVPETSETIAQIAAATRVPAGYLAKVLRNLSRAGLVRSQRGLHGGSVLARPATEIRVLDVVQAVDPIHRITRCPLGIASHGVNLCPLHRKLDTAIALVEEAFANAVIADLVAESGDTSSLCGTPAPATGPGPGSKAAPDAAPADSTLPGATCSTRKS